MDVHIEVEKGVKEVLNSENLWELNEGHVSILEETFR